MTFSASPTENVPAKVSPPASVPTTTTQPLTSPPAAYPIVLAGRPASNEIKPKIPPPVPPRGTPKAKKTGINSKGAKHDDNESFLNTHDDDFIKLELDMFMADKYNCAYCDCNFDSLKSSYSFAYIANDSQYYLPERTKSSYFNFNIDHVVYQNLKKKYFSDDNSIDTQDYEKYFRLISTDSIYLPCENDAFMDKSMTSIKSDDFYELHL